MAEALWELAELQKALGADAAGEAGNAITGVSIDTRTLQPGDLFFAIKGDNSDGHAYLDKAFEAGAALAVVSRDYAGEAPGPVLRVADTFAALNALGAAGRARSRAKVVAVTGSAGKTGTKEMLRLMLSRQGRTHASDKSYNNHWGVPLTAARLPRDADFAVFEIGMNHAGEITPLTQLVCPHAAIVTMVAPVHLEHFHAIEAIAEAKAEIFHGVGRDGAAILPRDSENYRLLAARARECGVGRVISFGRSPVAEVRLLSLAPKANGTAVEAEILGERLTFRLGAPGEHLAMNALAGLAAVEAVGASVLQAAAALAKFAAPAGRGAQSRRTVAGGSFLLIDESYNANPASMAAALAVLGGLPPSLARRRIAVLGDMLELGAEGTAMHRALAAPVESAGVDAVFASGPQMAALYRALPLGCRGAWAETSSGLTDALFEFIRPGDAIMVKGSNASRMGLLVENLKQHFPEAAGANRTAAE